MASLGFGRSKTRDFCLAVSAVMGVVLVWSRLVNLSTSFWSDEAYSAEHYSGAGPHAIFFSTWVPNNHVLYNLLSWATTRALGRFEAAFRLWSVVPGLAAIALVAYWAWNRIGPVASMAIVVLATVSPTHLTLTTQARGYGLAMFAGAAMLVTASRASDRSSTRDVWLFAACAIAGIWTLPVFAVAAGGQALVLFADRALRRVTLLAGVVITVASLVFYAPMLGDIAHNAGQQFGARLPVYGFVNAPYRDLARPTLGYGLPFPVSSTLTSVVSLLLALVLICAAVVRLVGQGRGDQSRGDQGGGDRVLLAHLTVPVFVTYFVFVAARFFVQPRFASYLLFHALLLLAIGVQQAWDAFTRTRILRIATAVLVVIFAFSGVQHVENIVKAQARVPWENTRFIAQIANNADIHTVYTDSKKSGALDYYLGGGREIVLSQTALDEQLYCKKPGPFVFVDDFYHRATRPKVKCLLERKALRMRVPQQLHPPIRDPGPTVIYVVPAGPGLRG